MPNIFYEHYTVIIPCKFIDKLTINCIETTRLLYPTINIIVLPDYIDSSVEIGVKVIITGDVTIAAKRNIGVNHATTEYIALIDSDAYPIVGWLENCNEILMMRSDNFGAVGGPNLSPNNGSNGEIAVGSALKSFMVSGFSAYKKKRSSKRYVDELPSCNLIFSRKLYLDLGGMNERLITGEDVDFCNRLKRKGLKIFYHPDVAVFHKNRDFKNFFLQRLTYGASVTELISCNLRLLYILYLAPFLFIIFLLSIIPIYLVAPHYKFFFLPIIFIYFLCILIETLRFGKSVKMIPLTAASLFVGNLAPGLGTLLKILHLMPDRKKIYKNF